MHQQSITVFRSRLRDDVPDDYATLAAELEARAASFPGFVEFKEFTAADGERLALVTFGSDAAEAAWRRLSAESVNVIDALRRFETGVPAAPEACAS